MVPLTIAVPVPFGVRVKLPFEFVMLIVLPSTLTLSTSKSVDTTTVPDGVISDSNYAQYILFGGSDAAHSALVDSQY